MYKNRMTIRILWKLHACYHIALCQVEVEKKLKFMRTTINVKSTRVRFFLVRNLRFHLATLLRVHIYFFQQQVTTFILDKRDERDNKC